MGFENHTEPDRFHPFVGNYIPKRMLQPQRLQCHGTLYENTFRGTISALGGCTLLLSAFFKRVETLVSLIGRIRTGSTILPHENFSLDDSQISAAATRLLSPRHYPAPGGI